MKRPSAWLFGCLWGAIAAVPAIAQSIVPADDGTGTVVTPNGDRLDISGGRRSQDNRNLFHSFQQFDLDPNDTANFRSQPEIHNIFGRINGGSASSIQGLIQVTGGVSNLYLMNPAGIVFGAGAQLNVPANFIATTATGIEFANGVFAGDRRAIARNLVGEPTGFAFVSAQPGAIVNESRLNVSGDRTLALLGGSVANAGELTAAGGTVVVSAVPGSSRLRLSVPGNLLSLEIEAVAAAAELDPLDLPELLTGGGTLVANPDGTVQVPGSAVRVRPSQGTAIASGNIDVSSPGRVGATPATIAIFGDRVAVLSARLDASQADGGRIFVGGDFRGGGTFPRAQLTYVDPFSWLVAESLNGGDGGQVVVWADGTTVFEGTAIARGANRGGRVEISGRDRLVFRGAVDAGGAIPGTVLFDPDDVTLDDPLPEEDLSDPLPEEDLSDPLPEEDLSDPLPEEDLSDPLPEEDLSDPLPEEDLSDPLPEEDLSDPPPPEDDFEDNFGDDPPPPEDNFGDDPPPPEDNFGDDPPPPEDNFGDDPPPPEDNFGDDPPPPEDNFDDPPPPEDNFGDEPSPPEDNFGDDPPPPEDNFAEEPPPLEDDVDDFDDFDDDFDDVGEPLPPEDDFDDFDDPLLPDDDVAGDFPPPDNDFDDFIEGVPLPNVTVTPERLANIAGRVIFEAANDITVATPIRTRDGIELRAGRSIRIDANLNVTSPLGDIFVVANDEFVAGDRRQPGAANLIQAPGTRLSSQLGGIVLELGNAGAVGDVRLGNVSSRGAIAVNANGGNIRRSQPNAVLSANTVELLTQGSGGIGTANAPLTVDTLALLVNSGRGGQFVNRQATLNTLDNDFIEAIDLGGDALSDLGGDFDLEFDLDDIGEEIGDDGGFEEVGELDDALEDIEDAGDEFDEFDEGGLGLADFEAIAVAEVEAVAALEQDRLQEFATALGGLANANTSLASARDALSDIARQTGSESAVVYVTLLPRQLDLLVFTSDGEPIRRSVPVSAEDVLAAASDLRSQLTNPRFRRTDGYLDPAQRLYDWAIAPILPQLEAANVRTLLFSMPAGLRTLPVAALHDGEQFLIEQFGVSLIPSLGLVDTRYRPLRDTRVLAMGASEFGDGLDPLPAVPVELQAIAAQWGDGSTFLNDQFTRANLVRQRQRYPYPIVHLATHGEFLDFDDSYIQLWDERLQLDELRQLGWNDPAVELVVLSACRTAVGSDEAELGFAGFAVAAGVKSALASLWYVSDEGTLALMSEFYSRLRAAPTKAEALRQAQLSLLQGNTRIEAGRVRAPGLAEPLPLPAPHGNESRNLAHPYFWAGFTLVGSPW